MQKIILWGMQGGAIATDSVSQEPIAFIPNSESDSFSRIMKQEGIETEKHPLSSDEDRDFMAFTQKRFIRLFQS